MRENPYLIRMEVPEDCIKVSDRDGVYYRLFNDPVTAVQKDEMDCMQFHSPSGDRKIGYHEHTDGTETFLVSQGAFECYCMGHGFIMRPGDILHIQPWMGHSFTPIEPESRLNILFQSINQQYGITVPRIHLQTNFPGVFEDPEFKKMFTSVNKNAGERAFPATKMVPDDQVTQLRRAGKGIREHEYEGIKLHLKIAKYETFGVKEVWDLFLKPGFYCEWDNFLPEYRMFYVTKGKIHCSVKTSATETMEFDAVEENIVFIPPYTPFKFETVEDTQMYDLDCPSRLQDLCEELNSYKEANPDKPMEKSDLLALCKRFAFNCTDVGYKKP
ncbi:MAG: cupin domain-containing protein [Clostridiales bacterium]|jgi:quercetin dioxygenase-like cupin family protein|nr:cupin domain-containing protein [Clostridiales bacterium]